MPLRKLAISQFTTRKVRTILTVAAITFSVALVVAVTSGYASAESAAMRFLNQFMGTTDATIGRINDGRGGVRESLVAELRRDPDVQRATGRLELETGLIDSSGKPIPGRPAQIIGIRRPDDTRIENLNFIHGKFFETSDENVAVIDQGAARVLKDPKRPAGDEKAPTLAVGDTFRLPGVNGMLELKIVGIVRKPAIVAAQIQTIYVPIETLQKFAMPSEPPQVGRILIDLKSNANPDVFLARWKVKLAQTDPVLRVTLSRDNRNEMDKNLQGVHFLSYLGGTVSMLAATFIVFSSLSMGVAERQRTLAVLRAVGAARGQVGGLVVLEGITLAIVGIVLGVPLGWFCVWLMSFRFEHLFAAGVVVSWGGVLFGSLGMLGAAVLASFLPAWSAMRVSPLEAMGPLIAAPTKRVPIVCALVGLVCISIDPLLMFGPNWLAEMGWIIPRPIARAIQFYGHFALGLPGIMVGFFLLAPLFVWNLELIAGRIVAMLLGVRYTLLRQQLSTGIWRAAGTCAALMVGLAILVVMQTQGKTMLNGWKLPDKFPDIFIAVTGMRVDETYKLEQVQGIRKGEVMPLAIASPEFGTSMWAILGAAVMPDATMFFGVDPDKVLQMMELDFRDGNPADATRLLKQGRHLIITDEFRQLKGLKVGDTIKLKSPIHGSVEYTVAGVVWSPGIDVMVSMFDLGKQFEQRTAASVFGSLEDARNDFGVDKIYFFAANLDYFLKKETVMENVKKEFGAMGVQAYDVRQIKKAIQDGFGRLLSLVSTVAFAAMAVASLGVTNTIMASVRSRQWQFGILRSVGVTRGQLLRLVVAEAMMLGIVGCALGLVCGFEMSVNAKQLSVNIIGYDPPMFIPWNIVWIGTAIVMGISILASLWPAISVARSEPLTLLQAGRASA